MIPKAMTGVLGPKAHTPEWFLEREGRRVGGSRMAILLGATTWSSLFEEYAVAKGLQEPLEPSEAMELGLELEEWVAMKFSRATGHEVFQAGQMINRPSLDWAFATPDYWVDDGALLECKTGGIKDGWRNGIPRHIVAQCQWQLFATGLDVAYVAALLGGKGGMKFVWDSIPRDQDMIDQLVAIGAAFVKSVDDAEPPTPDGSAGAVAMVKALFPTTVKKEVVLPMDAMGWDTQYVQAKKEEGLWKRLKDEAENRIKMLIGDAERAVLPDGNVYTWSTVHRKETIHRAGKYRLFHRKAAP